METLQPLSYVYFAIDRTLDCNCDINMTCNNTEIPNEVNRYSDNGAEIGMVPGIILALLVNILFAYKYNKFDVIKQSICCTDLISAKTVSIISIMSAIFMALPLLILFCVTAFVYKSICTQLIKRKDKKYAGLLDSFDVFWGLEDETSKSIINVVGIIESQSSAFLVSCIKEKLETVYTVNKSMEKIFLRRSQEYGFYYWRRNNNVDLDEYIKIVNYNEGMEQNDGYLEELMGEYSEKPLPYNNEGLFQILVTACPIKQTNANQAFGIIFKVHHSLGDGIALIELLCQNFADDDGNSVELFKAKNVLSKPTENSSRKLIDKINTLIQMPVCFAKGIIRVPDENALHGPTLTGNKIFTWTHCDENLLPMMKEVKRNKLGVKCVDLLTTALSEALRNYFKKGTTSLPEEVAVILPIRFPKRNDEGCMKLENNFSVAILDVPIAHTSGNCDSKLDEIRKRYDELRSSADPVTNYYFLKFVGAILPNQILKPMLTSRQATLVLSNIPGPELLTICGGNSLKQLVFFVPNKGNTGLGVTAMSYGGVLRLAAAADRALVSDSSELKVILDGMVAEIRRLHRLHCSH